MGQLALTMGLQCLWRISFSDVGCLWAFGALDDLEFDGVSFLQGAIALSGDAGIMNKDIGTIVASNEAVPLGIVEPFYNPCTPSSPIENEA